MTPAGHLAAAVIASDHLDHDRRATALCLAGAVIPDLVDKTAWRLGLVETGHTLAHSVVTVTAVAVVLTAVDAARPLRPVLPGYAAHVVADVGVAYPRFVVNYAWPLLEQRPTPDASPVGYWVRYAVSAPGVAEAAIVVAGVAIVARRGLGTPDDEDGPRN
ncbi:MAG: metal-dependent hydrolase [Haloferacaceae archaeon]